MIEKNAVGYLENVLENIKELEVNNFRLQSLW